VCQEVYVELLKKNDKWIPERGSYITFAATLARHVFVRIKEQARTVHLPKNGHALLHIANEKIAAGTMTDKANATAQRLMISAKEVSRFEDVEGGVESQGAATVDEYAMRAQAKSVVMVLEANEAVAVGMKFGLWGQPIRRLPEISRALGITQADAERLLAGAMAKMREAVSDQDIGDHD
jgi:hypothetical protein